LSKCQDKKGVVFAFLSDRAHPMYVPMLTKKAMKKSYHADFDFEAASSCTQGKFKDSMRWRKKQLIKHIVEGKSLPRGYVVPKFVTDKLPGKVVPDHLFV
jgi:hypothetical protein